MTEEDNRRRIGEIATRLDVIDMHGTRGMEAVRVQLGALQQTVGKLDGAVERMDRTLASLPKPQRPWAAVTAFVAAVIPMYALVIDLIVSHVR